MFPFFNEKDILEIRLHELDEVVDRFILVEATLTHSGLPKPLYYEENKKRFAEFSHKIIHIIVDDMPTTPEQIQAAISSQDLEWLDPGVLLEDNWVRERFQRNQIMQGLTTCNPDDIIIIEDADELVSPDLLKVIDILMVDGSNAVGQELRTCYMNWLCTNMTWAGSKIIRRKFLSNPSETRFHTPASKIFEKWGWHFTMWGGEEAIKQKILSYAHDEFTIPEVLENIGTRLRDVKDVLGRQYQYKVVPIDDTLPKYLLANLDKFSQYIYKE